LDLATVGQLLEDLVDDPLALLDVLQFAAAEQHVDQDLVVVLEELAGLVDLGLDVVVAGLGADADLFQLLLMDLVLAALARLLVTQLAVVEDLAHRRGLVGGDLDEVEVGLAGHVERLRRRHDAQLFAVGADQAHRTDADLLVDARTAVLFPLLRLTIGRTNTSISSFCGTRVGCPSRPRSIPVPQSGGGTWVGFPPSGRPRVLWMRSVLATSTAC